MKRKIFYCFLIFLTIGFLFNVSPVFSEVGVSDNEILIGVVGIYTGPVSYLGDAQVGGEMAFDAINKAGGIHGRKLVFVKEDTAFSPAKTIGALKKLIYRDKVFAIWGCVGSSPAMAGKPVTDEAKVPWVETTSTDRKLTKPVSRYLFTCQESSFHEATGIAKFVVERLKVSKICIIHDSTGYGLNQSEGIVEYFKKVNISPLARELYKVGDTDFSSQILKIREKNPEVTIISGYTREIGHIVRQAMELGLKTQFVTVAAGSEALGRDIAGKGAYSRVISATCLKGVFNGKDMAQFEEEFSKAYPDLAKRPNRPGMNDAICYQAARVMIEGLKRAGKNLTRENFVNALETLKNFDSGTMTSTYSASEHCGLTYVNFQQWQADGTAKIIATGIESKD